MRLEVCYALPCPFSARFDIRTILISIVHQETVHLHEKILRHFDLCSEYGPCIGITRLHRWQRAQGLSLNPPIEVLAVLLKEDAKEKRSTGRIAYVDELAGTREVEVAA